MKCDIPSRISLLLMIRFLMRISIFDIVYGTIRKILSSFTQTNLAFSSKLSCLFICISIYRTLSVMGGARGICLSFLYWTISGLLMFFMALGALGYARRRLKPICWPPSRASDGPSWRASGQPASHAVRPVVDRRSCGQAAPPNAHSD